MSRIAELFDADPLNHSDQDINETVSFFREKRHLYELGDTRAGTVKSKTPKALAGADPESLKDLLSKSLEI